MKFDRDEKQLVESYEQGEWKSVLGTEEVERYRGYAHHTLKKSRRINLRISEADLLAVKKKAIEEGIPYQTLIASLIHKYVTGRLKETSG